MEIQIIIESILLCTKQVDKTIENNTHADSDSRSQCGKISKEKKKKNDAKWYEMKNVNTYIPKIIIEL